MKKTTIGFVNTFYLFISVDLFKYCPYRLIVYTVFAQWFSRAFNVQTGDILAVRTQVPLNSQHAGSIQGDGKKPRTIEYVYYYDSNQAESVLPAQDKFDPSFHVVTEFVTAERDGRGLVQKTCVEV